MASSTKLPSLSASAAKVEPHLKVVKNYYRTTCKFDV